MLFVPKSSIETLAMGNKKMYSQDFTSISYGHFVYLDLGEHATSSCVFPHEARSADAILTYTTITRH